LSDDEVCDLADRCISFGEPADVHLEDVLHLSEHMQCGVDTDGSSCPDGSSTTA